jgi:hypothetical protein
VVILGVVDMDRLEPAVIPPKLSHRLTHHFPAEPLPATDDRPASLDEWQFVALIHQSLNPRDVQHCATQELRPLLNCERVSFLERRGDRFWLTAISGLRQRPPRTRWVMKLEQFVELVGRSGRRFVHPAESGELSDDLGRSLSSYWEETHGTFLLAEPVFDPSTSSLPDQGNRRPVAMLVIEQFAGGELSEEALDRLDRAVEQLSIALSNARRHARIYHVPGVALLAAFCASLSRTRLSSIVAGFLMLAGLVTALNWIEIPFELECRGRLMPAARRQVFASLDGEVLEVHVDESARIEAGQVLARLQSDELERASLEKTGLLKEKVKSRDAARAELRSTSPQQTRGQAARQQAELEVLNSEIDTIERQLALIEQQREHLLVVSPIAGTMTTSRPREKLLGRPVRRGDALLEVMDETGDWQLELAVADAKLGHLLQTLSSTPAPKVTYRLLSSPQRTYAAEFLRVADRAVSLPEVGTAGLVVCGVSDMDSRYRRIGSDVSARIDCGPRSLAFLWFHEFWELMCWSWWL